MRPSLGGITNVEKQQKKKKRRAAAEREELYSYGRPESQKHQSTPAMSQPAHDPISDDVMAMVTHHILPTDRWPSSGGCENATATAMSAAQLALADVLPAIMIPLSSRCHHLLQFTWVVDGAVEERLSITAKLIISIKCRSAADGGTAPATHHDSKHIT
jgi:hypothetical protein